MKRAMATSTRVVDDKESDNNGDKGVGRGTVTATERAMMTAMRVAGNKEGKGAKEGNGNSNKGSGQ